MFYITDVQGNEPDILSPVKTGTLVIKTLDGQTFFTQEAPEGGWTHERLSVVQPEGQEGGADAFINGAWVGSTEV